MNGTFSLVGGDPLQAAKKTCYRHYCIGAYDVGAWVAFPHAFMYGDEIPALALLDAGIAAVTLPDTLPSTSDKSWKIWHFGFHAVPDSPEILVQGRERPYLEWFFRTKAANPAVYGDAEIAEYIRSFSAPGVMRAGLAFYGAISQSMRQNRQLAAGTKLAMPVLALSADQGSIPDMAASLRPFANDVQGMVIPDCDHFRPEEKPEVVADALSKCLGHERSRTSLP